MKRLILIIAVFISCNIEICIAGTPTQTALLGVDMQTLQASKNEAESELSNLINQLNQHRNSFKPSSMSEEDWQKEEWVLINGIEKVKERISLLNKQIYDAKRTIEDLEIAKKKAQEEAEKEKIAQEQAKQEELDEQRKAEFQQSYNENMENSQPRYNNLHTAVDINANRAANENVARDFLSRDDKIEGFSTITIGMLASPQQPQSSTTKPSISSKFKNKKSNENKTEENDQSNNDEEKQLRERIKELEKQRDELERKKQERDRETKKN